MFKRRATMDLATFVSGIVRALTKGQQALPRARMEQIEKHFERETETGFYKPKTTDFKISEKQALSIPNYCSSRTNNIGIDSAIIRCSARIVDVEQTDLNCPLTDHKSEVKYCVVPSTPDKKSFEIEIKFSKKSDCEAENKLTEILNGLIEVETISDH